MKDYRAPKGWKLLGTTDMSYSDTRTKADKQKQARVAMNLLRKTPTWKKDELYKEGIDAAIAAEKAKQSYFLAKQNGKLWSKGEKEASREAKRVARREARLAKKNLVTS